MTLDQTTAFFILLMTIFGALGTLLIKLGINAFKLRRDLSIIYENPLIIFGTLFYVLGSVLNILAYGGGDMSVVYPMSSLTYIWSSMSAYQFLDEDFSKKKISGIILIILGSALVVS